MERVVEFMEQQKEINRPDRDLLKIAIGRCMYWTMGSCPTSFHSLLFTLINKTDYQNREKLKVVFPYECEALELWQNSDDFGRDLFRAWGLMPKEDT